MGIDYHIVPQTSMKLPAVHNPLPPPWVGAISLR